MKSALCAVVSLLFLAASVTLGFSARAHQLSGTAMSNVKEGTMAPADAYLVAVALFVLGLSFAYGACKYRREK